MSFLWNILMSFEYYPTNHQVVHIPFNFCQLYFQSFRHRMSTDKNIHYNNLEVMKVRLKYTTYLQFLEELVKLRLLKLHEIGKVQNGCI